MIASPQPVCPSSASIRTSVSERILPSLFGSGYRTGTPRLARPSLPYPWLRLVPLVRRTVGDHGDQQDAALDDQLPVRWHARERQAVVDHVDEDEANERARERSPVPLLRLVPPRITAVITSSSIPVFALGWAYPIRDTVTSPGDGREPAASEVEGHPPAIDRDTRERDARALGAIA